MTSQTPASVDGPSKGGSHANDSLEERESTFVTTSSSSLVTMTNNQPKRKRSSTPESAPRIRKKTLKGKSKTSATATLPIASSATLDQASTSSAGDCKPFWTSSSNELSKKLWLPSVTDSVASPLSYSSPSSRAMECDSWFTVEKKSVEPRTSLPRTFCRSSTSSSPATMADDQQETGGNGNDEMCTKKDLVARKIKLELDTDQRITLSRWCGVYRWTYNECVRLCRTNAVTYRGKVKTTRDLRSQVANRTSPVVIERPWVLQVPYDVRDGAIIEFVKNLKTGIDKVKSNPSFRFRMDFKRKTDSSMSLPLLRKHWKNGVYFPTFFTGKVKGYEPLPAQLECDSKIVKTRTNEYFACIPTTRPESIPAPCAYEGSCIALDPGVRTFLTGYDPAGNILEIAKGDVDKVFKMCYRVDRIMSKVTKAKNHRQRYNRQRAACRARTKLQNCITDLHAKAAKYLCESYKLILLPKFTTQQMVRRATRKIRSKTARMMLTFSHYKFRQRLLDKAINYKDTNVMIVNEAYTSKTCTCCGTIHDKLGGNKNFNCRSCSWKGDRDVNGARNIYLRSVVEAALDVVVHPVLPSGPTPPTIYSLGAFQV